MLTRITAPARRALAIILASLLVTPAIAVAQTDYFNTDRGRPLQVQDAVAIERYAFELQAAPVRWSRAAGPFVTWTAEPELAYGIWRRTQVEVGVPVVVIDGFSTGTRSGVGAVDVSVLHALNVETLGVPAIALEGRAEIPAGPFGPRNTYATAGLLITRTTGIGRLHLNASWTQGKRLDATDERLAEPRGTGLRELSRWLGGVAVDHAFPLRSLLLGAEVTAREPMVQGAEVEWRSAAGFRYQLGTRWGIDGGIGRSFGDDREWSLTFGAAWSFGLVHLIPFGR